VETSEPRAPWEDLFDRLVDLPDEQRQAQLTLLAANDRDLARLLGQLLDADSVPTPFFEHPLQAAAVAPTEEEAQLPAGAMVGSWRVVRLIGRGGMGEVYLAERDETSFVQRAALKIIKRGMDSGAIVRRFLRERRILASLDHPNIARLFDGGVGPDGRPFFALEYVEGEPITEYCRRQGLSLDEIVKLMQTVAETVASAHRQLVVHRDLKPANILVTPEGVPKLLDFGIAKLLEEQGSEKLTVTHLGVGALTPAYAAPEQILGETVSMATDVYALGVLLYELVTGEHPHRRNHWTLAALITAIEHESIERPSATLAKLDAPVRQRRRVAGDLDLIILTALHRDQSRRYASAQRLADELGRFLAGRPIDARGDDLRYRLRKLVARNRVAAAAVGLATIAVLGGLAAALWQAREAHIAARHAAAEARRAQHVAAFLVSIFGRSDPEASDPQATQTQGLTARDLLEQGAAQIDTRLANEPEVQADLFEAVARVETNLSLVDPALLHAHRALALRRAMLPPTDGRVGLALAALAGAERQRGSLPQANQTFESALKILIPAMGEDSVEVAVVRRDLAESLPKPEQSVRAVALEKQALATFERRLGPNDFETATTLRELGSAYEENGQYQEAEDAYRRALVPLRALLGPLHGQVLGIQVDLAGLLDRIGRPAEARPMFETAIAGVRKTLGPRHILLAEDLFSYGVLLINQGDFEAGDRAFTEALSIYGRERFEGGHCVRYLGVSAMRQGRYEEAAQYFTHAAEIYSRALGPDNVQRWRALANLGFAHFHLGKVQQAQSELREAVDKIDHLAGGESYEVRAPLKMLGEVETADGETDRALKTLDRARALEIRLFKTRDNHDVAATNLLIARALLARDHPGDVETARRELDEGLGIFARVMPTDPYNGETLLESGRLALRQGDRVRAQRELAAAESQLAAAKGVTHTHAEDAHRLLLQARKG
jgi:tetratricopeptide (TPR) repeat protein/tRNA A-37 threonylcarbamoyl transferase component Bud32